MSYALVYYFYDSESESRSQWPRGIRRGSAAARSLGLWIRISLLVWMSVCCECFVFSGRGLCDEAIPRPNEPYRVRSGATITHYSCKV